MGIKLHGLDFSPQEVLAELQPHINTYKSDLEQSSRAADELYERYTAVARDKELAQIKLIYMEALKEGLSLERARGRAEGHYLKPEKLEEEDEEIQTICELFN
jgi:hypothetical protein